jgi:glycogen debranching enzyme
MLMGKYFETTGDRQAVDRLSPNIDSALKFLEEETQRNGYLNYGGQGKEALSNQGWKDSGDSVMYGDGQLVKAPIALAEVQGYLYSAWRAAAQLKLAQGDAETARQLEAKAEDLKTRFNSDFWLPDKNFVALALDGEGRPSDVISSNPGHLIGTGLLTPEHAFAVQDRLLAPDMYSGYGIRTLSSNEVRYSPSSYHDGSIWPHDNSLIVSGMHDLRGPDAVKVMLGMIDAAQHQPQLRLPELFGGFPRAEFQEPIPYPVSCIPQAWAAGSMIGMLRANLGMHADALANRLLIYRPTIPDSLGTVNISGMRVGNSPIDLQFRNDAGKTTAQVINNPNNISVDIVP